MHLSAWAKSAKKVLLAQPSAAAAERVFSLMKHSFGDQQLSSPEDYLETSLLLQYVMNSLGTVCVISFMCHCNYHMP